VKRTRREWETDIKALSGFLAAYHKAQAALRPPPRADYIPDPNIARRELNEAVGQAEGPAERGGASAIEFVPGHGHVSFNVVREAMKTLTEPGFPIEPEAVVDSVEQALARLKVAAEHATDEDETSPTDRTDRHWAYDYSTDVVRDFSKWLFGFPIRAGLFLVRGFKTFRPRAKWIFLIALAVAVVVGYVFGGWTGAWGVVGASSILLGIMAGGRQMEWW